MILMNYEIWNLSNLLGYHLSIYRFVLFVFLAFVCIVLYFLISIVFKLLVANININKVGYFVPFFFFFLFIWQIDQIFSSIGTTKFNFNKVSWQHWIWLCTPIYWYVIIRRIKLPEIVIFLVNYDFGNFLITHTTELVNNHHSVVFVFNEICCIVCYRI